VIVGLWKGWKEMDKFLGNFMCWRCILIFMIDIDRFDNQLQFWLSCLGSAVGYGNIWRFPYKLYNNGGGVFFIPFVIFIIIFCLPIFYLETAYGQLFRLRVDRYFDSINSKFLGVGFAF
jgi:SNF family Na+-dependent transporter